MSDALEKRPARLEKRVAKITESPQITASELGRIGGRSIGHASGGSADPLAGLDSETAVRNSVARLIADVYSGKLRPSLAGALAHLLNLQLRVH